MAAIRAGRLDLGMGLAAAGRGYKGGKYSNPNEYLKLVNGAMWMIREKGKNCLVSNLKTLDFKSNDYFVDGADASWYNSTVMN